MASADWLTGDEGVKAVTQLAVAVAEYMGNPGTHAGTEACVMVNDMFHVHPYDKSKDRPSSLPSGLLNICGNKELWFKLQLSCPLQIRSACLA